MDQEKREKWIRVRIRGIGWVFALFFVLVLVQAFQLQIVQGEELRARSEKQYQKTIPLTPQRGTIYDRNGEALAVSLEMDSIYADPDQAAGEASTNSLHKLAELLDLPRKTLAARLNEKRDFVWLKRQVVPDVAARVKELSLPGVRTIQEHGRYYPNASLGGQVIGFTGLDPRGLEGLELKYDTLLLGRGGYLVTERDALGRGLSNDPVVKPGRGGHDLFLTLDKNIQYIVEKELKRGVEAARAKSGTAVVVEPKTGQVLAMATWPTYNPNAFRQYHPSAWRNRAICDNFEPGSTVKAFLIAAALDEGVIQPEDEIYCEKGSYRVSGKLIQDHHSHEKLNPADILKYSSNIGAAKIGKMLERESYYRYLRRFGFGEKTGIDLPGEVDGLLRDAKDWFEMDLAAISFGQGISVTPLQLTMATAAIVNDGRLMVPYLVDRSVSADGEFVDRHYPHYVRQVVSTANARLVRDMLERTTGRGGTATLAAVPGYRVGGKTGTAQKVDPVVGGYSADKRIGSFVGFIPADNPQLVITVLIDEPQDTTYGGLVAAPVFAGIAGQAMNYLKIPPTEPVAQRSFESLAETVPGESPVNKNILMNATAGASGIQRMPDFAGLSYRQVLRKMKQANINVKFVGSGRVVAQQPQPGELITYQDRVQVTLSAPDSLAF
ncbi:MAG: penicillin-binding protein [Desulfuromonadales bacterium]|nr:penicillin-binding protein [Desulfuromonadales bacterium]